MVQLPQGSGSVKLSSLGRLYMMYSSVAAPGISIVNHAHLPGRFQRESVDVLPCGYQSMNHWTAANWVVSRQLVYFALSKTRHIFEERGNQCAAQAETDGGTSAGA